MRIPSHLLAMAVLASFTSTSALARDYISIVGSSTVYPFATVVAERFGKSGGFATPRIESTGSGGGMKLFCGGIGVETPDITNASRRIKQSEIDKCAENGVDEIVEILIGFDGIAVANSVKAEQLSFSINDLYMALAKDVPNPDGSETLVPNPYTHWNDVNTDLPNQPIEVLGPPPTSGTRDAFVELVMEAGCSGYEWIETLENHKSVCASMREDGSYIEAGENDNLIVQKLDANPNALGIFGFSFLDQNSDIVQSSLVNGHAADFDAIADGEYPISRPLYVYVKKAHVGTVPGIAEYIAAFTDENAWGPDGYLGEKGMIPLDDDKRSLIGESARSLTPMDGL